MPKAHAVTRRGFARTCACAARGRVIALSVSMSVCLFVCLFVDTGVWVKQERLHSLSLQYKLQKEFEVVCT